MYYVIEHFDTHFQIIPFQNYADAERYMHLNPIFAVALIKGQLIECNQYKEVEKELEKAKKLKSIQKILFTVRYELNKILNEK